MTVIVVLSDCPKKLRGDMTKWFIEVNTGVYVGNLNSRVRDELWIRITENIGKGHATMVFSCNNEQHMDFRVHNSYWQPKDFEGIKLMLRPAQKNDTADCSDSSNTPVQGFSNAAKMQYARRKNYKKNSVIPGNCDSYVVLDFETTGLNPQTDEIIEIGALKVENDKIVSTFDLLIKCGKEIPEEITQLTGITNEQLNNEGADLESTIKLLRDFVSDLPVVCHNAPFEQGFLFAACKKLNIDLFNNRIIDTKILARVLLRGMTSYKLKNIAEYFSIPVEQEHRALPDCETTYKVYVKLKELEDL
ncbi:MAG: type I-E CRISPR-associated endoribonuclease Cas2e [Clostridiales bacterium]|nr:type I-E CRISPR-associated endoribonuclease Cas2e [Clostridiales bacterium]